MVTVKSPFGFVQKRLAMKRGWIIPLVLFLGIALATAQPAQIILLRHAEKPDDESHDHLTERGHERARALVGLFTNTPARTTNGLPVALYVPRVSRNRTSVRPYETLEPLAKHLKLQVFSPYQAKEYEELAAMILKNPDYRGRTVVICWVQDFLPELAQAFGVKGKKTSWKASDFDRLWLITFRDGKAVLANLPQRLLPGDSRR